MRAGADHFQEKHTPVIVGITGGSGAGKTWLAHQLLQAFPKEASLISLDDFYLDRSHLSPNRRRRINFDHPRCIHWADFEAVLQQCQSGKPVSLPVYDFATHSRGGIRRPFPLKPLIVAEGLWLLRRRTVRRLLTLSVFVDCSSELRFTRRLQRDCRERGRSEESVRRQFRETVEPMHEQFVASQAQRADIVLTDPITKLCVANLVKQIRTLISDHSL